MVKEYQKQHYLPSCYLKHFSSDPKPTRKSHVWRSDGETSVSVSNESQCQEKHFYSESNASAVEKMFGASEAFYGICIETIKRGGEPDIKEYFGLLLIIMDLHIRGIRYENRTGEENFNAYQALLGGLRAALAGDFDRGLPSDEEVMANLKANWRLRILRAPAEQKLVSSDGPSLWFTTRGKDLDFAILPLSPEYLAVAYDKRKVSVHGNTLSVAEANGLNQNQCYHAVNCIFTGEKLDADELAWLAERLREEKPQDMYVDQSSCMFRLLKIPKPESFAFLKLVS